MSLSEETLCVALATVPAGRWAVAVSGGADSVALLHLVLQRHDIEPVVVHLDHQTRAGESTVDATFVSDMCARLGVPIVLSRRSELEHGSLPSNTQARYRALRLRLFSSTVAGHKLAGVLQAHHADDQAETVFMRLLRGAGIEGLVGIPSMSVVDGVRILRPLLTVRRSLLRQFLEACDIPWREDSSNQSTHYQRNRVRQLLAGRDELIEQLLRVQAAMSNLSAELAGRSPVLAETFALKQVAGQHPLVQLHALRDWALARGALAEDLGLDALEQLRLMVEDMGAAPAVCLPGDVEVRRRRGTISVRAH